MKYIFTLTIFFSLNAYSHQHIKPHHHQSKVGKCWSNVIYPAEYGWKDKKIKVKENSFRYEIVPAQYKNVRKRVMVREPAERLKIVEAKYDYVVDKVLKRDSSSKLRQLPLKYKNKRVKVLVRPSETVLTRGHNILSNKPEDDLICEEERPAEYAYIDQKVLEKEADIEKIEIAKEYELVKRRVIVEPAKVVKIKIPAEYKEIVVAELVKDSYRRRIEIPEEYKIVKEKVVVREASSKREEVVCANNVDSGMVVKLQKALNNKGFNVEVDGILGAETKSALKVYQNKNRLPHGYLSMRTINKLGL